MSHIEHFLAQCCLLFSLTFLRLSSPLPHLPRPRAGSHPHRPCPRRANSHPPPRYRYQSHPSRDLHPHDKLAASTRFGGQENVRWAGGVVHKTRVVCSRMPTRRWRSRTRIDVDSPTARIGRFKDHTTAVAHHLPTNNIRS